MLELNEHVELATLGRAEQERGFGGGIGCLADRERAGVMGEGALMHLLEEFMQAWAVREALVSHAEGGARRSAIGQAGAFGDDVDRVHAEAVDAAREPPVHHVVDRVTDRGVFPVQVRLLPSKQVEVVLARGGVVLPGRATEE